MTATRPWQSLLLIVLLLAAGPASGTARPGDAELGGWVEEGLAADPRVQGDEIDVSVRKGIVTLSGSAPTLLSRNYAVLTAQKIHGVLGVIDQLEMEVPIRSDGELAEDVRWKIERSPVIQSEGLGVSAKGGVVTLQGVVGSWGQRHEAQLLASEVRGVREVRNFLSAKPDDSRADGEIERDVVAALRRDVYLTRLPLRVDVGEGVATIAGSVGSAYERARAENLTRWVEGVRGVRNRLDVVWSGGRAAPTADWAPPSDSELEKRVAAQLDQETRIDASRVHVTVVSGRVSLRGVVPSVRERRIAEEDVWNVAGVGWVASELWVDGEARPDSEIEREIQKGIAADSQIFDVSIGVQVAKGVVTLSGRVASRYQRGHAGAIAARTRGVQRVDNRLSVAMWGGRSDGDLANEVTRRLARDWSMAGLAGRVRVRVDGGTVTLDGTVDHWAERRSAGRIAAATPGVRHVRNRIVVGSYPYPWEEREGVDDSEGAPDWDPYYFDHPILPWVAAVVGKRELGLRQELESGRTRAETDAVRAAQPRRFRATSQR